MVSYQDLLFGTSHFDLAHYTYKGTCTYLCTTQIFFQLNTQYLDGYNGGHFEYQKILTPGPGCWKAG